MQERSLEEIRNEALRLHEMGAPWHFHVMSPSCVFNEQDRYAFILEGMTTGEASVHYSDQAEKELGLELSPLLHGKDILTQPKQQHASKIVEQMVELAKNLNEQHIEWHHHMLFPGCRFNDHSPQYTLVLEDPRTSTKLESLSDGEPSGDLSLLEKLFYSK